MSGRSQGGGKVRFDVEALRGLAGARSFARGEAYHQDGLVELLEVADARVLARVSGGEDYRTVVTGRGASIGGECACLAFDGSGACKHMVAVALAANAAAPDQGRKDGGGVLARIREHLRRQEAEALVELIVGAAERDAVLLRKLDLAAAAASGDDKTLRARLRKAIDAATRVRSTNYDDTADWAAGVDAVLDSLDEVVKAGRGALALELAEHALARVEEALEVIDDSDGYCGGLMQRCADIHLAAVELVRPDPVALARDLFGRETEGATDAFYGAAQVYEAALGAAGLAEYKRLALEAWAALPVRSGPGRASAMEPSGAWSLRRILDEFAEREGDLEARIALRARDLASPWDYWQLAAFCAEHGRQAEALNRAEEGLWVCEGQGGDERLALFTVELYRQAGRQADAQALLQRTFERAPSLELYQELRKCGPAARDGAIEMLQARLVGARPGPYAYPADLLVRILKEDRKFDRAWAVVGAHGVSLALRVALAEMSEADHRIEALAAYGERVEGLIKGGTNPGYAEAAALVGRMAGLREPREQATYVLELKVRHGRKRNFMQLLG